MMTSAATLAFVIPSHYDASRRPRRQVVAAASQQQEEEQQSYEDSSHFSIFDMRRTWRQAKQEAAGFWKDIVHAVPSKIEESVLNNNDNNDEQREENNNEQREEEDGRIPLIPPPAPTSWITVVGAHISDVLLRQDNNDVDDNDNDTIMMDSLLSVLARSDNEAEEANTRARTFLPQILSVLLEYREPVLHVLRKYLGDLDFSKVNPTSLWYFLEYEEERKNASWKRLIHRFCERVNVDEVEHLYHKMILAGLGYADTVQDVQSGLDQCDISLVYADLTCQPAKPSHFIAIPRKQSAKDDTLQVLLVVRGTKTLVDAVTDLCGNAVDYRGGKAHEYVLKSGQYLVEKHLDLLNELRDQAGASRMQLTAIGHSLGAGAAAFVALELQDEPDVDVEVYGFGTPAVVSAELAQSMASCMTTVIADSDVVARLSGETLANALLDVMELDYRPRVERDIAMALRELQQQQPLAFSNATLEAATRLLQPLLDKHMELALAPKTTRRHEPILFPPGQCIHFYRDGMGISGRHVPNTFFREIDVTRRMIRDHLRFGYEQIFLDLMRYQYQDLYYQFNTTHVSDFNKQVKRAQMVEDKVLNQTSLW